MIKQIAYYLSLYLLIAYVLTGCTQWKKITGQDDKHEQPVNTSVPTAPVVASTETLTSMSGALPQLPVVWVQGLPDGSRPIVYTNNKDGWYHLDLCVDGQSVPCYQIDRLSDRFAVRFRNLDNIPNPRLGDMSYFIWIIEPK